MPHFKQADPSKLRAARIAARLSLAALAEMLDIGKSQIVNIETGYSRVTLAVLARWADACGIDDLDRLCTAAPAGAFDTRKKNFRKSSTS